VPEVTKQMPNERGRFPLQYLQVPSEPFKHHCRISGYRRNQPQLSLKGTSEEKNPNYAHIEREDDLLIKSFLTSNHLPTVSPTLA
jgi:hypothetical protein